MSKYWGYVCLSHDPPLEAEQDLNHGDDALIDLYWKVQAGEWPMASELCPQFALAYEGELAPMATVPADGDRAAYATPVPPRQGGGAPPWTSPLTFLQQHPHCVIAVQSEYGERRSVSGTVQAAPAAQAIEP